MTRRPRHEFISRWIVTRPASIAYGDARAWAELLAETIYDDAPPRPEAGTVTEIGADGRVEIEIGPRDAIPYSAEEIEVVRRNASRLGDMHTLRLLATCDETVDYLTQSFDVRGHIERELERTAHALQETQQSRQMVSALCEQLMKQRDAAQLQLAHAQRVLRRLEWSALDGDSPGLCPYCGESAAHDAACDLAAALDHLGEP